MMRRLAYICVPLFFVLASLSLASAQTYSFGQAYLPAGKQAMSIVSGDVNGDGRLDLVVANLGENTVSVFLAKPDGTFGEKVDLATGLQPYSVAVGDFNADGNLDIAVTNENCTVNGHISTVTCGTGSVSVLLGIGDGAFQPHAEYATGTGPISVAASDLNGDGKLDLVVVNNHDNSISVLLGKGDGTFATHVDYPAPSPSLAIVGDFNHDGKPDVAASTGTGASVWLGNGDGTLQTRVDFRLRDQSPATSLAAADFNRDGNQDLAVSGAGAGVSIFLGNGDGTFTFRAIYSSPAGPTIAVDLNNDGKTDLVIADTVTLSSNPSFGVAVLLGNGDGTFQPAVNFASATMPSDVVAGDFNGDGQLDVAISNNSCFTNSVNFVDASCAAGSITVLLGNAQGVLGAAAQNAGALGSNPTSLLHVDLNGDQTPDLVVVNQGDDTISVLLGNGDGTFSPQVTYATGHLPVAIQAADFKGDGKTGLVVVNQICGVKSNSCMAGSVSVLLGNGDGTLQPHVDFAVGTTPMSIAIADFNGDSKPDLAVTNANLGLGNTVSILTGNGDGTFNPQVTATVVSEPGPIVAADFNHDGKIDLAIACADLANSGVCPPPVSPSILLGNGNGTFQRHDVQLPTSGFFSGPSLLSVGDFNGDTIPDLIAAANGGGGFSVFLGKGDGTFQTAGTGAGPAVGKDYFALGDFFGDDKLDVALAEETPRLVIFHGHGDGTFESAQALMLPPDPAFSDPVPVSADFNGDGSLDLAVLQPGSAKLSIFLNEAFKSVTPTTLAFHSQGVTTSAVQTITIAVFAFVLLCGLSSTRNRRFAWVPVAAFSALISIAGIVMGGCGGGSSNPSNPNGGSGTAAGNYTITVTATAGSGANAVAHTTKLTLTVQ
jgi:FG-GAP-like repeat/FG-GAP repeat